VNVAKERLNDVVIIGPEGSFDASSAKEFKAEPDFYETINGNGLVIVKIGRQSPMIMPQSGIAELFTKSSRVTDEDIDSGLWWTTRE